MTLFGVGLIAGGVGLLGYAYVGSRARKRADRQADREVGRQADREVDRQADRRDWSAIDGAREGAWAQHRGFDRLRGLPFIRRSALLDETEPVVAPDLAPSWSGASGSHVGPAVAPPPPPPPPPPTWPTSGPIEDTEPINRIGMAPPDRDDTVPITYATPVPVRID